MIEAVVDRWPGKDDHSRFEFSQGLGGIYLQYRRGVTHRMLPAEIVGSGSPSTAARIYLSVPPPVAISKLKHSPINCA